MKTGQREAEASSDCREQRGESRSLKEKGD